MKKVTSNDGACEIKRSQIIFRLSIPTNQNGSESIVPTVCSFNDPTSRFSFIFTHEGFSPFFSEYEFECFFS
nr:hypothetical protein [Leptospira weilii]